MIPEWADQIELTPSGVIHVGWVERSDTHRPRTPALMGIASLHPSYEKSNGRRARRTHLNKRSEFS